ncbi:15703_t:CDS:2, partial [Gigaspora rosea]
QEWYEETTEEIELDEIEETIKKAQIEKRWDQIQQEEEAVDLFTFISYKKLSDAMDVLNRHFQLTVLPPYLSKLQDLPKPTWEIFGTKKQSVTNNDEQ